MFTLAPWAIVIVDPATMLNPALPSAFGPVRLIAPVSAAEPLEINVTNLPVATFATVNAEPLPDARSISTSPPFTATDPTLRLSALNWRIRTSPFNADRLLTVTAPARLFWR